MVEAPSAAASGGGDTGLVGGRFKLGPALGGTHTGEVHRAVDNQGGATVAVKLVAPEVVAIPQVAQRIERELKQLERVAHKNVAKVIASGKHGDRVFIATELIEGARPLGELVAASGPLDPQRASDLVLAIGEALIDAAKVGVVHRDLSPKNILVTADSIKLINFCVPAPSSEKAPGVPEFVAPESVEGKPVDQRSNIYSLASIHYFLLTGRAPHIGTPAEVLAAHLAGAVEPPSKHAAVPADVDALVVRALERNAAKRYLTLRQFLDEVERVARGPEGGIGQTAPFGRAGKTKELESTLMGFGFGGMPTKEASMEARTRQIDVEIPPEAMREVAALDAAVARAHQAQQPLQAAEAPVMQAAQVMPAMPPGATVESSGSPWAPPREALAPAAASTAATAPTGHDAFTPAAAAMQQAAPAMGAAAAAAPAVAAPVVAAPKVTGGASGKKKGEEKDKKKEAKGKFRETMWFKKGELDAAAADEAAATGDVNATGKADLMPIEERYSDDGSINASDAQKYSLKTGATQMMKAMREGDEGGAGQSVSERELVGEMKGGRNLIIGVILLAVLGIGVAVYALML